LNGGASLSAGTIGAEVATPRTVNYSWHVVEVVTSATFDRWLRKLKDRRDAARVLVRIDRLAAGKPGDVKPVGHGVSELRIEYGPGYRVYFLRDGDRLILLLIGGDKSTQDADIRTAHSVARTWHRTQGAHE
jgi:putative addiction module killer protein